MKVNTVLTFVSKSLTISYLATEKRAPEILRLGTSPLDYGWFGAIALPYNAYRETTP